ncbi:ShlB/FhaC/HecB family hemolysin secretion/activation protein [Vibrio tubiashii]|uniref:ShlB/FhaC/HecB family hemolysin secretion/activation protein n=1 Tax=Vibrio tubiashii TaxID=29498 RepID=A0AAE5GS13_9VIBR|nr:ShlB/FhaC/HecB family hemolysin secretion/activation protein [Vibrio tubiashii]NOI81670.1 ShlB/FhaC/HecB family hemolysin secretion/activation protein [Vibrio tubiashii]
MQYIRPLKLSNILCIFVYLLWAKLAVANTPLGPLATQDIERQQQERLESLNESNESLQKLIPSQVIPDPEFEADSTCVQIEAITFSGNKIYDNSTLKSISEFKPGCITLTQINEYLRLISNHYIEAGYVTSRAFMTPQDLSSGVLNIVILEGKVEKVLWNGEERQWLKMAFPMIADTVLNLRGIEQGLDQINRLSRYNATIKLLPSSKQGYSVVDLQTAEGQLGSIGVGFSNSGQKSTGEEQIAINLSGENFFKWLDKWTLSATQSAAFVDSKQSDSLYLGVDVPIGYWNVGYRTSYSTYKTTFTNSGFTFDSSGKTNNYYLDSKWLFFRDGTSKSALKLTASHRREKNYILGNLVEASSRNLSMLSLAWEHSTRVGGGFLTVSPNISIGTDWFGGEENLSSDPSVAKAQFRKGMLTGSYTYPFTPKLTLISTLFGQWTNDTLYGSERVSIGGEYSVRGYKGTSLSGDEGYYWRNDVTYQIGQWPYVGAISAQVAVDTGSIAEDSEDQYEGGSLMGSSFALRTSQKHASSSFTLGLPIAAPSRLKKDDFVVYYRIDLKI